MAISLGVYPIFRQTQIVSCVPLFLIEILNRLWVEQLEQAAYFSPTPRYQGFQVIRSFGYPHIIQVIRPV